MELQKLRYFYTVAKFQHMTKAAEYMCIAQPALSQAIKSLEQELSVELFSKKGRNIVLTPYGEYLYQRLETILPEIDSIPAELQRMKGEATKTVRLNILAASAFVIDSIVKYRKINPDVVFDYEQSEQKADCNIVIYTNGLNLSSTNTKVSDYIKRENIYLAVPRESEYSKRDCVDLSDMKGEGFIMLSSARLFGALCNDYCRDAGFYPKVLFESDSRTAVQNIVSTGAGVAFWPEHSWGDVDTEKVSLLSINKPKCHRDIVIELHSTFPESEYAKDFYDFLINRINRKIN